MNNLTKTNLFYDILFKVSQCIFVTILGMIIGKSFLPPQIASFAMVLILIAFIAILFMRNTKITMTFNYFISALMGVGLYPSIEHYISKLGVNIVLLIFSITCIMFIVLALYGKTTKKDISRWGRFLFISLIVLIILSIVKLFIPLSGLNIIIILAGIFIFSAYIIFDINQGLKDCTSEEDIPLVILNLYLDFINLFLQLLELVVEVVGDND